MTTSTFVSRGRLSLPAVSVLLAIAVLSGSPFTLAQSPQDVVGGEGTAGTGTFRVDAVSGPSGENASGILVLELAIGSVVGAVTCLHVDGNEATVGGRVEEGSTAAPSGSGFIFHVIDRGSAGLQDLIRLELIGAPPSVCPAVEMIFPAIVTSGDIVVIDAIAPPPTLTTMAATVAELELQTGLTTSFLQKLESADASLSRGDQRATCGQLMAFKGEVEAQSGRGVPPSSATMLLDATAFVLADLHC